MGSIIRVEVARKMLRDCALARNRRVTKDQEQQMNSTLLTLEICLTPAILVLQSVWTVADLKQIA